MPCQSVSLPDTGEVAGALAVDAALWSAVGWRAHVAGQAGAGRDVVLAAALRERATRVRVTRVHRLGPPGSDNFCNMNIVKPLLDRRKQFYLPGIFVQPVKGSPS